jgi:Outer membrane protein beta-barrel domain
MAKRIVLLSAAALLVLVVAAPSVAQEGDKSVPAYELSGGYGFMRDFELEENVPAGWYFSATANLNRWFGVVGEIAGSHKTLDDGQPLATLKMTLLTGMGGPRFFRKFGGVVPYTQALVGAAYARGTIKGPNIKVSEDQTDFAFQPGVGVLMYFNRRVGAQVSADYRWINPGGDDDGEDTHEFRFLTGIVVGFGSR